MGYCYTWFLFTRLQCCLTVVLWLKLLKFEIYIKLCKVLLSISFSTAISYNGLVRTEKLRDSLAKYPFGKFLVSFKVHILLQVWRTILKLCFIDLFYFIFLFLALGYCGMDLKERLNFMTWHNTYCHHILFEYQKGSWYYFSIVNINDNCLTIRWILIKSRTCFD